MPNCRRIFVLVSLLILAGCSEPQRGGPREKTSPVTGTINVDGVAAGFVQVECHPESGSPIKYALSTLTDEKGIFSLTTYEANDGLPPGTYILTFAWPEPGLAPIDKLKGAYANPKKSKHKITVVDGQDTAIGTIELSTKGPGK